MNRKGLARASQESRKGLVQLGPKDLTQVRVRRQAQALAVHDGRVRHPRGSDGDWFDSPGAGSDQRQAALGFP